MARTLFLALVLALVAAFALAGEYDGVDSYPAAQSRGDIDGGYGGGFGGYGGSSGGYGGSSGWGWGPRFRYFNFRIPVPVIPRLRIGLGWGGW